MANIYDIAREANVSRSTVSRVLNDHPSVSEDKRKRVKTAIEKLKYTPSATARALALSKTNTIGVVVRELAQSFYDEFVNCIQLRAEEKGYGVLYAMKNPSLHNKTDIGALMSKKVDGYLFIGEGTGDPELLADMGHNQIPYVGFEFVDEDNQGVYVNIDNRHSGFEVVKYLYKLGHRNTIHITYKEDMMETRLREEGYYDGIAAYDMDAAKVFDVGFAPEVIYEDCKAILPYIRENKVTAAFCANNVIATYFMELLISEGYSIPEDFSVVGFDDTPVERPLHISRRAIPEITSVKQNQGAMARYGIDVLIKAIEEGKLPRGDKQIFECSLVERESCGEGPWAVRDHE